jgi:pyridoxamine 5'-phosphate oxidase
MDISGLREEYSKSAFLENNVLLNPFDQFAKWFGEAVSSKVLEPNAMHLATLGKNMKPDGRIVLLKDFDENGFTFYTNYQSRKAADMAQNPFASITFFWPELERQIRIEGIISKVDTKTSSDYFEKRPRKSQIGAWASPQSQIVEGREVLENNFDLYEKKFENTEVPKPDHWGGYNLSPDYFEFWQGRRSRLHDRITFSKNKKNDWKISRLAP